MAWEKEYSALVISKIDSLAEEQKDLKKDIKDLSFEVSKLRTKSAVWGAVAGTLFSILGLFLQLILGVKK